MEGVCAVRMIIPQPFVVLQIRTPPVGALEQLVEDVLQRRGLLRKYVALRRLRSMLSQEYLNCDMRASPEYFTSRRFVSSYWILLSSLTSKNCLTSKTICLPLICRLGIACLSSSDLAKMTCKPPSACPHLRAQTWSAQRAALRLAIRTRA